MKHISKRDFVFKTYLSVGVADDDRRHRLDDGAIYYVAKGKIEDENIVG